MRLIPFGVICSSILLTNCTMTHGKGARNEDAKYSYDLDYNGCKTGKQSFSSKGSYCKGLQDEKLNKGCAGDTRKEMFASDCVGEPVATEDPDEGPAAAPNLDPAVKKILDLPLTGAPVATGGEYLAVGLTIGTDGYYTAKIARGLSPSVTADAGTEVSSNWTSDGIHMVLNGLGTADAGTFDNALGVALTINSSGLGIEDKSLFLTNKP